MAEARRGVAEYHTAMRNCLGEFGVVGMVAPGGLVATGGPTDGEGARTDAGGMSPVELARLESQAMRECLNRVPYPPHWHNLPTEQDYQRMLENRECLIAHGLAIREPPALEAWLITRWNPWSAAINDNGLGIPEIEQFMEACPQHGIHNVSVFS